MAFVDGERGFFLCAFAQRVYSDLRGEVFTDYVAVPIVVEVKGQKLHFLTLVNQGFDYVMADSFSAAINV